jgi:hypothetical protein
MNAESNFTIARRIAATSGILFILVLAMSVTLVATADAGVSAIVIPGLVCLTVIGPVLSITLRHFQVKGNLLLRDSQYRNSFQVPIGDSVRDDYYNNVVKPSVKRLGATTLENTKFTLAVLDKMLWWSRLKTLIYFVVFVALLAVRQIDLGWILLATQTMFSSDVIARWYSMERFRLRTKECRVQLKQHYIESAKKESLVSHAFILRAFTNYECAKDEFAEPLSQKVFDKLNPQVSELWDKERCDLGI